MRCTVAKETVDGAAQPKKKMSKKRKLLIALGVIAGVLVGAWVLVVTPAINKIATEQIQAAGLEGAIVEIRADGAKITMPTLPASLGGDSGLTGTNVVFEFGGLGVDDINLLIEGGETGNVVLPEGTRFTMTADTFSSFADLTVVGTDKTAALTGTISNELAEALAAAIKDGKIEGSDATAGLPMSDIVLTPGSDGTVMTATIDVAAMLALLAN
jgi:hypothetical protein